MIKNITTIIFGVLFFHSVQGYSADLQWFGQAAFKLTTDQGQIILIDPFISKNPKTPDAHKDLEKLGKVDLILVTHGHGDHLGDTSQIAKLTGAKVAMNADMGSTVQALGIVAKEQLIRFNKGGPIKPIGDDVVITLVRAEDRSSINHTNPANGKVDVHPGGEPSGFIIQLLSEGKTLYHAGDTGVFGDMIFIGNYYQPDYSLIPIGGHFTMDPEHAAYAVDALLKTPKVIPMHYATFPPLKGTPQQFKDALKGDTEVIVMEPGQTIKL